MNANVNSADRMYFITNIIFDGRGLFPLADDVKKTH